VFKEQYTIAGIGLTEFGRLQGMTPTGVKALAAYRAIKDAGLDPMDVDGIIAQVDIGDDGGAGDLPRRLGIEPKFFWSLSAGGTSGISAIVAACGAIAAGAARYVICVCGATSLSQSMTPGVRSGEPSPDTNMAYGFFGAVADHALEAQRHMHLYGTTERHLGVLAVTQRAHANKRPEAQMHGRPMTMDNYLASPMVVAPLRRFDSCLVSDGGAAIVVTTAERAKAMKNPPVYIMGAGFGHQVKQYWEKTNYTTLGVATAKDAAFREAGLALNDIDFAEFYEPFTINVLVQLEDYGFCKKGEGGPFVEAGHTQLTGRLPLNTGGGQLSWCYMQGYTPLSEAVLQLTGRAGATQLPPEKSRICLVSGHGGTEPSRSLYYSHGSLILRR
jgi:acetyl-CoA acetyltransferase